MVMIMILDIFQNRFVYDSAFEWCKEKFGPYPNAPVTYWPVIPEERWAYKWYKKDERYYWRFLCEEDAVLFALKWL
jgi:hypothetical protein